MRRFAALLAIVSLLACAGGAVPCRGDEKSAAKDSCCDPGGSCGDSRPAGPDCPCCPQLRPALLVRVAALPPGDEAVPLAPVPAEFRPSPPSREILHVPKADPSIA